MIYWFFGFPGTGKDYCAKVLGKNINASYVHVDDLLTEKDKEKLIKGKFTIDDRISKLKKAVIKINKLLKNNSNIVAADSLPDNRSREFLFENFKNNIIFIRITVSSDIHKRRFLDRKNHFFTEELLASWVKKHWQEPIKIPHLILENNIEGEKELTTALKKISNEV